MNPLVPFFSTFISIMVVVAIFGDPANQPSPEAVRYMIGIGVGVMVGLLLLLYIVNRDMRKPANRRCSPPAAPRPSEVDSPQQLPGIAGPKPGY